jgi:type IV pilus assembly protein PilC
VLASDLLRENTIVLLCLFLAAVAGLWILYRAGHSRRLVDPLLLKLPFLKVITIEVSVARAARTLSSLLSAGVDMLVALEITADVVRHGAYRVTLLEAKDVVGKGGQLAEVFSRYPDRYPPFLSEMAVIGAETGKLSEMLGGVATFYEGEVDQKMKNFSTIIEPLLMILIGIGVGFFAISMILPTYALIGSL